MFVTLLTVAVSRLRVRAGAAIIGSMLTFAGTAVVVVGGMLVIFQVWTTALAKGSVTPIVKSSPSAYQAR